MTRIAAWAWFVVVQLIALLVTVLGWVLLIPFCLAQAWTAEDRWSWGPLNYVYGNPEDGVSGRKALIWTSSGQVPYLPNTWAPWRAYLWSGWRNSADNLKYVFAWKGGPFIRREFGKYYVQLGWNDSGYPVLSAGSK